MKSATDLVTSHEGLDKIDTKILRVLQSRWLGCCRFPGHLVKVEYETGGGSWE
jgi:hypothetical protein